VSSAPLSPAFLITNWSFQPCQAGSPCALGAHGEDLAVDRLVAARYRSRRGGSRCTHRWLLAEPRMLQNVTRALCPGLLHWLVGHTSRSPICAGQSARCVSQAERFSAVAGLQQAELTLRARAGLGFSPEAVFDLKFPFLFFIQFLRNSNFTNLYLNIQSSKNYESSSVGFIIF
jgi:hypothetical protein